MSEQEVDKKIIEARQGLVQYIGALITKTGYQGAAARQVVCALLLEEALKLVTVDERIELYSAKPILRATNMILRQRINDYEDEIERQHEELIRTHITNGKVKLEQVIERLNYLIDSAKKVSPNGGNKS
jgi:hypothetical protein